MRLGWIALAGLTVVPAGLAVAPAAHGGEPRGGRIERVEHRKSEMVRVPAGTFAMGFVLEPPLADDVEAPERKASRDECRAAVGAGADAWCRDEMAASGLTELLYLVPHVNATPRREVFLPAFDLDRHEVTITDYRACVGAGACDSGPLLQGDQRGHADAGNPVTNVTWREASEYCAFVGKRLPTEAEWEKAASGADGRRWPWGEQPRADGANHGTMDAEAIRRMRVMERSSRVSQQVEAWFELVPDASDGAEYAVPPGTMRWSESRYGAMDLAGNVAEWVADYYGATGYEDLPADSPVRRVPVNADTRRSVRGGSWLDLQVAGRTFARSAARPGTRSPLIGFRCARDA